MATAKSRGSRAGAKPRYDVIVVGAGPSGLMAALSASQGTPFWSTRPKRFGRVLVLEEHEKPGGIAAFGRLSIANGMTLNGGQLKAMLLDQVRSLPIDVHTGAAVTGIRRAPGKHAVVTTAGTFHASAVIIACGIFSHLAHLRFRNTFFLAETLPGQRAFVKRAEEAVASGGIRSKQLLMVGSHPAVEETAKRLRSRTLDVKAIVDSRYDGTAGAIDDLLRDGRASRAAALREWTSKLSTPRWNAGNAGVHTDYLAIVFDYNTYKLRPENAVRFARGSRIRQKDGYVIADHWGRTNVPGIWACGNVVFPLSGVLQALYTGFVAGLSARSATELAAFDEQNGFLPWLATPNSAWAGWLGSARDLFT